MTTKNIASFTDPEVMYTLTLNKDGRAVDCNCPARFHGKKRNPNYLCKHQNFHNQQKALADQARAEQVARRHVPLNGNRGFSLL